MKIVEEKDQVQGKTEDAGTLSQAKKESQNQGLGEDGCGGPTGEEKVDSGQGQEVGGGEGNILRVAGQVPREAGDEKQKDGPQGGPPGAAGGSQKNFKEDNEKR